MTHKDIFKDSFPQDKQIGGSHYKDFNKLEDLTTRTFIFNRMNLFLKTIFPFFREML
jgi:hypothetical protein